MYLHGLRRCRPLNDSLGLRTAVWLQAKVSDRGPGQQLYAGSVCDDSAAEVHMRRLWRHKSSSLYIYRFNECQH